MFSLKILKGISSITRFFEILFISNETDKINSIVNIYLVLRVYDHVI